MENILFFSIIFSLFINFTCGAINFSGVNRTFLLLYKGVIESSIAFINEDGSPNENPYFYKETLERNVDEYLFDNLTRYVTSYTVSFNFFHRDNGLTCTSKECQAVKITLDCKINYLFSYTKARNYYINSNYEPTFD